MICAVFNCIEIWKNWKSLYHCCCAIEIFVERARQLLYSNTVTEQVVMTDFSLIYSRCKTHISLSPAHVINSKSQLIQIIISQSLAQQSITSAMLQLIQLYEEAPETIRINLEFKNIKDLIPLMGILSKFKHAEELSLHGNKLTHLPPLESLKSLKYLDISNNPVKVDRLQYQIDKILLDRLFHMPKLEALEIKANSEERQQLIESLPKLQSLNGQAVIRQTLADLTTEEQLKKLGAQLKEEMEKVKVVYERISKIVYSGQQNLQKSRNNANKDQEFFLVYRDAQQQMNYFYSGLQDSLSREGVFAYCKHKLTAVLDNLMIRILDELGDENIVRVYEEISKIKADNFDNILKIIFSTSYQRHIDDQLQKPSNKLRKETLYQNQLFRVKKELVQLRKEQNKMSTILNKENQLKAHNQNKIVGTFIKRLASNSGNTPKSVNEREKSSNLSKSNSKANFMNKSPSKALLKSPSKVLHRNPSKVLNRTPSKTFNKTPSKLKFEQRENDNKYSDRQRNTPKNDDSKNKILNLQQLIELIAEIMSEKRKYNNKNLQKNEEFQTLQQFLYSFFSRKYGLKAIALEWSLSTIKSIQRYCRQSVQVQIFGKILKNQLYQHYYDNYKQFKAQIGQTFKRQKVANSVHQSQFRRLFMYFYSFENKQTLDRIIGSTQFPISTQEMSYFLQSYKLAFQEKHLKVFVRNFDSLDNEHSGSLSKDKCRELYTKLIKAKDVSEAEKQKFTKYYDLMIQKYKKDSFIFSEVFQLVHKLL